MKSQAKQPEQVERTIHTHSVNETEMFGTMLGKNLEGGDILCLHGTLGAGKTALTRGLAAGWGSNTPVTSPTFTLINLYEHESKPEVIYHVDAYRLKDREDILSTGIEDILFDGSIVIIEWPERLDELLPVNAIRVTISVPGMNEREFHISGQPDQLARLLDEETSYHLLAGK